jgi:hypothetical protein
MSIACQGENAPLTGAVDEVARINAPQRPIADQRRRVDLAAARWMRFLGSARSVDPTPVAWLNVVRFSDAAEGSA